jgi:threonine dehydratase
LDTTPPRPEAIEQAPSLVNPLFLNTPQFQSDGLSERAKHSVVVKVETINPVRSFKGRGSWLAVRQLVASGEADEQRGIVVASSGNFGQAIAYAGRAHRIPVTVFVDANANPVKVARTRSFGAEVVMVGRDFDEAREHAAKRARDTGQTLVTDGRETAFAVGAGTIALEVTQAVGAGRLPVIDTAYVPVGNGSLIVGIGTWLRHASPSTRVVGVQAEGAPSMTLSWRARRPVETENAATSAEGLATRVPVPEAVEAMRSLVDDMILLPEEAILQAQQDLTNELGVLVEAAGAAAWAACVAVSASRSASLTIVTGSNLRTNSGRPAGPAC